jgi:membrane protein DedA with SNARE-associated domain
VFGGMIGAMFLYYLGKYRGRALFEKYNKYYLRIENLTKIENCLGAGDLAVTVFAIRGRRSFGYRVDRRCR